MSSVQAFGHIDSLASEELDTSNNNSVDNQPVGNLLFSQKTEEKSEEVNIKTMVDVESVVGHCC